MSNDQPARSTPTRPRRRTARAIAIVAGLAVTAGAIFAVASAVGPDQAKAAKSVRTSIELYEVTRGDFEITTTATGDLRARNQIEIRNNLENESTITEIIPEGTSVKKGDVLVRLNAETIQQRLDEEALALETARAQVIEATEAYEIQVSENDSARRAAELKLALAELELRKWREGELKSKEQELAHNLDRARKEKQRLQEFYERSVLLEQKNFYSKDKLKQDQLALEQAVAALEKAELAKRIHEQFEKPKDEKQKNSDVEEARAEVERILRQNASRLASKDADKKNKQQSLAIREQKFNKYREQLEAATIKAPSDGLVVYSTSLDNARWGGDEGPLQVGSKVWPNQTLIVLPDTREMVAAVRVHESLAGRIRKGQPCTIKIDAMGDRRFTGQVDSVGILAEQTSRWMDPTLREYTVKILLDIPPDLAAAAEGQGPRSQQLRPSMRCEAEIILGKVADAVTVPIQAVHSEGLLRFVHIADGSGRFARRPVLIGQRSDRFAEVRAGVEPGERILLRKPEPSELVSRTWDPKDLAAVGLQLNEMGDIVPIATAGGPGGPNAGRGPGKAPGADGNRAKPAESAPAETAPPAPVAAGKAAEAGDAKIDGAPAATQAGEPGGAASPAAAKEPVPAKG